MKRRLLKTMAAVLAIAAAAAGPVRGQNSTTYNVTFGGFNEPDMNTTVNVASLPHTFTGLGDYSFVTFLSGHQQVQVERRSLSVVGQQEQNRRGGPFPVAAGPTGKEMSDRRPHNCPVPRRCSSGPDRGRPKKSAPPM